MKAPCVPGNSSAVTEMRGEKFIVPPLEVDFLPLPSIHGVYIGEESIKVKYM
jgi:hypothetical protein